MPARQVDVAGLCPVNTGWYKAYRVLEDRFSGEFGYSAPCILYLRDTLDIVGPPLYRWATKRLLDRRAGGMDIHLRIDQPEDVRPGETLPIEPLVAYLRGSLPGLPGGAVEVKQFRGGFSNLTYLLRFGERELVLRRPPVGADVRGGHDMGREYQILLGLHGAYGKAPTPILFEDDPGLLGAPFYVMERVRGVILRGPLAPGNALPPGRMRAICHALVDTLVELHALDYRAAGLGDLGRPEGYTARQVAGWTRRYEKARTSEVGAMEEGSEWMASHLPPPGDAALIHNDFKYDNVVLDRKDLPRVRAVLDWEMATIGDPLTDLGTTLAYWIEEDDPPALRRYGLTTLPGNLDREAWVARYAESSGRDVSAILFYFVYGLYKNAVIVQQIYARYRKGLTRDPRFAGLDRLVQAYAGMAARAIERGRIRHIGTGAL